MRKSFQWMLASAAASAACAIPNVHAQTSGVTLGGRLDLSVNYLSGGVQGGGSRTGIASDTSYFFLLGTEQLGNQLSAVWRLESGFQADNGTLNNAALFNRLAYVGLEHEKYGQLVFGQTFNPYIYVTSKFDPFRRSQSGALFTLLQGTANRGANSSVVPNSLSYIVYPADPITVRLHYRLSEKEVPTSYSGAVEYASGPLALSLLYDSARAQGSTVGLPAQQAIWSKTVGFGALYDFGVARLSLWAQQNHVTGLPNVPGYLVGVAVPFRSSELGASYAYTDREGARASLASLGYTYFFSKRTRLYMTGSYLQNKGQAKFDVWPMSQGGYTIVPGSNIKAFQIGMRHLF